MDFTDLDFRHNPSQISIDKKKIRQSF